VLRPGALSPASRQREPGEDAAEEPRQLRSPEFDADCAKNQPDRLKAYRLEGGSHLGRNRYGHARGCKNRDVGVGWNSVCCP
jgi:hypothetical protein